MPKMAHVFRNEREKNKNKVLNFKVNVWDFFSLTILTKDPPSIHLQNYNDMISS